MKRSFWLISICFFTLFGCSKTDSNNSNLNSQTISNQKAHLSVAQGTGTGGTGYTCNTQIPLTLQPDGTYTTTYAGVPVSVSSITYRIKDNNGNPWPVRDGDPVLGTVSINSAGVDAHMEYNGSNPQDDQFSISIARWGGQTIDLASYQSSLNTYVKNEFTTNGFNQQQFVPDYLYKNTMPMIDNYIKSSAGGWVSVTGRIIRSTTGSGFALAPPCYPRPGSATCTLCAYCQSHPDDPRCNP